MRTIIVNRDGPIATVTLDRPNKANAQNFAMRKAMVETFRALDADPSIQCIVITGSGDVFSSGHDLSEDLSEEEHRADTNGGGVYASLAAIRTPSIAAINGPCIAQGAGLALLCDIRIAAAEATFRWPHAQLGIASVSGPVILSRFLPWNVACEFLLLCREMSAEEALRLQIVNEVVDVTELMDRVRDIARVICSYDVHAVRALKEIAHTTRGLSLTEALIVGDRLARLVKQSHDGESGARKR